MKELNSFPQALVDPEGIREGCSTTTIGWMSLVVARRGGGGLEAKKRQGGMVCWLIAPAKGLTMFV